MTFRPAAFAVCVALGALLGGAFSAVANEPYPTRPIRFLQGFAVGGNADTITRMLAAEMFKEANQPVVPEARPGAGGNIASEQAARAEPDGYTLVTLTTAHVISPALYKSLKFDPVADFEFISNVTDFPFFIVVNADSPIKTIEQFVAQARAKPGTVTVGTAGVGSGQHMCTELLASSIGTKFLHVPYRGESAAVAGLLGGNVDAVVSAGTSVLGNIEGGKLRALAISGAERWPQLPAVPTVSETVHPGFEMMAWVGVATTGGVPKPIVERLNAEFRRVIALPRVQQGLRDLGGIARSSTPEEMEAKVSSQIKRWTELAEKAGIERQ